MNTFFSELQRRGVFKVLIAYLGLSWLSLEVISVLSGMLNLPELLGTAILITLICLLPLALYISWYFDVGLSGISRTTSVDNGVVIVGDAEDGDVEGDGVGDKNLGNDDLGNDDLGTNNSKAISPWSWVGLIALMSVSAFFGVQYYGEVKESFLAAQQQAAEQQQAAQIEKTDSIAVLPFTDNSSAQDQAFFATGLAEEITSLLGRTKLFRVSASRSSQVLLEKGFSPLEIGERLGAQTIMKGTIDSADNRVNVRVELQDTGSGRVLWTQSFARAATDIFELESEISRAVVNLLQDDYLESGDLANLSTTNDVDAYVLYLKGREAYRQQTSESMIEARSYFERAIAADPEYAQAYVALADALASLSEGADSFGVLSVDIAIELAEINLHQAAIRNPNVPELFAVDGVVSMLKGYDEQALLAYDRAIELNPNLAIAYLWKSLALNNLQQYDEALTTLQQSQILDPLFLTSSYNLGLQLSWLGRHREAEAIYNQIQSDFPESPFPYIGRVNHFYAQGNYVGAIREWLKATELSPENAEYTDQLVDTLSMLGLSDIMKSLSNKPRIDSSVLIFEGKYDELFDKMTFEVAANPDDYWVAWSAGWYHSMFGDANTAAELITKNEDELSETDKFFMPYCSPGIELAWAHQILGNNDLAKTLVDGCESALNKQREGDISVSEVDYLAARIYAFNKEPAKAVIALKQAIDNGWREWWTRYDPLLKLLDENAEIEKLIKFIDDDLAKQREEALALFNEAEE